MRPGEPNRTRHREVYGAAYFFGGVALPMSIKARSLHALDQLLNSTSHMPCFWGMVNRRSLQDRQVGSGVCLIGWISPFLRARTVSMLKAVGSQQCTSEDSILGWD